MNTAFRLGALLAIVIMSAISCQKDESILNDKKNSLFTILRTSSGINTINDNGILRFPCSEDFNLALDTLQSLDERSLDSVYEEAALAKFENELNFTSMRYVIETEEDNYYAANERYYYFDSLIRTPLYILKDVNIIKDISIDTYDEDPNPDETHFIQDPYLRTVLNPQGEVYVGESYIRFIDKRYIIEVLKNNNPKQITVSGIGNNVNAYLPQLNTDPYIRVFDLNNQIELPEISYRKLGPNQYLLIPRHTTACSYTWKVGNQTINEPCPDVFVEPGEYLNISVEYIIDNEIKKFSTSLNRGQTASGCLFDVQGNPNYVFDASSNKYCEASGILNYNFSTLTGDYIETQINWGDNTDTVVRNSSGLISHKYASGGAYLVTGIVKSYETDALGNQTLVCEGIVRDSVYVPNNCPSCITQHYVMENWQRYHNGTDGFKYLIKIKHTTSLFGNDKTKYVVKIKPGILDGNTHKLRKRKIQIALDGRIGCDMGYDLMSVEHYKTKNEIKRRKKTFVLKAHKMSPTGGFDQYNFGQSNPVNVNFLNLPYKHFDHYIDGLDLGIAIYWSGRMESDLSKNSLFHQRLSFPK